MAAAPLDPSQHLLDYGLIGGAVLSLAITRSREPGRALMGPVYDPQNPRAILSERYAAELGGELAPEKATQNQLMVGLAVGWVAAGALVAGAVPGHDGAIDMQRLHHGLVGYAEALVLTVAVADIAKIGVGALRPDFQDRVRRTHCAPDAAVPLPASDCVGVPVSDDPNLVDEGRRSFFSGHAATAFATAGYLSLQLGGRFVWGDGTTAGSRALGIAGQAALLSVASWVAWGRVDDNRHHPVDVTVGAAVGLAFANLGYWRFFDTHGQPRGAPTLSLSAGPDGSPGLGLNGTF